MLTDFAINRQDINDIITDLRDMLVDNEENLPESVVLSIDKLAMKQDGEFKDSLDDLVEKINSVNGDEQ